MGDGSLRLSSERPFVMQTDDRNHVSELADGAVQQACARLVHRGDLGWGSRPGHPPAMTDENTQETMRKTPCFGGRNEMSQIIQK